MSYLLVDAGFTIVATIGMHDVLLQPPSNVDIYKPEEMRETYKTLFIGAVAFGTFGILSIIASIGFLRAGASARRLWIGTSALMVLCIVLVIGMLKWEWKTYIYGLVVVALSWWFLKKHAASQHREP